MNLFYDLWLPVVVIAYRAALGGGSGTAVRPSTCAFRRILSVLSPALVLREVWR